MTRRVALLGTGQAAAIHTRTLRAIAPDVERRYASRTADRGREAAARWRGSGWFPSYEAAIDDPAADVVLIALPPALHLEWTLRALAAGKHVIVEKPPVARPADIDTVAEAARRAGRQVCVAENYFYKPLARVLRTAISRGDLGEVRFIHLNALKQQRTGDWRDDPAVALGGALFEGGIHWISLLANIGLTPVMARGVRVGPAAASGRNALVTIEYAEGAAASLSYSWDLGAVINGVRFSAVYGTAGTLRFETNGLVAWQTGRRRRVRVPGLRDLAGYRAMMRDFLSAIRDDRPPAYDLATARRDVALLEQASRSAADT